MTTQQPNDTPRRPGIGRLYLQGLAIYLTYRLREVGAWILRGLTAPWRRGWAWLQQQWRRLKPGLARHKRRLIWSALALLCLSLLVGGGITLYLWRDEAWRLALRLQQRLAGVAARVRRPAEPVVVVARQAVAEAPAPVRPGGDGAGQ